jgi:hypothetical protein
MARRAARRRGRQPQLPYGEKAAFFACQMQQHLTHWVVRGSQSRFNLKRPAFGGPFVSRSTKAPFSNRYAYPNASASTA